MPTGPGLGAARRVLRSAAGLGRRDARLLRRHYNAGRQAAPLSRLAKPPGKSDRGRPRRPPRRSTRRRARHDFLQEKRAVLRLFTGRGPEPRPRSGRRRCRAAAECGAGRGPLAQRCAAETKNAGTKKEAERRLGKVDEESLPQPARAHRRLRLRSHHSHLPGRDGVSRCTPPSPSCAATSTANSRICWPPARPGSTTGTSSAGASSTYSPRATSCRTTSMCSPPSGAAVVLARAEAEIESVSALRARRLPAVPHPLHPGSRRVRSSSS